MFNFCYFWENSIKPSKFIFNSKSNSDILEFIEKQYIIDEDSMIALDQLKTIKDFFDLNSYDQVIMGNVLSAGLGQAPARQAAILAGLNVRTECLTINKMCGSGLKAVMIADNEIKSGAADIIVAGGMESMSNAPLLLNLSLIHI